MNKSELASYLVSLHTLLDAQMKSPHALANATLAKEYDLAWEQLKDTIEKEHEDARQSKARA